MSVTNDRDRTRKVVVEVVEVARNVQEGAQNKGLGKLLMAASVGGRMGATALEEHDIGPY